jgi:hypothetical protein
MKFITSFNVWRNFFLSKLEKILYVTRQEMQFCVTRVILRDHAALVPQIFHSLHKIRHFLTGYINSYFSINYSFLVWEKIIGI